MEMLGPIIESSVNLRGPPVRPPAPTTGPNRAPVWAGRPPEGPHGARGKVSSWVAGATCVSGNFSTQFWGFGTLVQMAQKQLKESLRIQDEDTAAENVPLRRGRVRPKERVEIIAASAAGKSRRQIAKQFHRSPNTIQAVLRRQDGRAMKADFQKTLREEIRSLLILGPPMAAESWRRAVKNAVAGKRTNYQAARDWLLAAGIAAARAGQVEAQNGPKRLFEAIDR